MFTSVIHNSAHLHMRNPSVSSQSHYNTKQSATINNININTDINNNNSNNNNNNDNKNHSEQDAPTSGTLIHVTKSKQTIRLASLASTRPTQAQINSGQKSISSSIHSYYSKVLSSVMLDLGGKLQQLATTIQKNHKVSESRVALISDDCYVAKQSATIVEGSNPLIEGQQEYQKKTTTTNMQDCLVKLSEQDGDLDDQESATTTNNKQLPIYNDCQPLLKIAPRFQLVDRPTEKKVEIVGRQSELASSSRVKYSIESLEYRRHPDNVTQSSFQCRSLASAGICTTTLWLLAIHLMLLPSCLSVVGIVGANPTGPNQILLYSPGLTVAESAPASAHQISTQGDDYGDDGSDLDVLSGQPQISTAHLLSAAGHIIPDNYFGQNSVPLAYAQSASQQHDQLQSASSERDTVASNAASNQQATKQAVSNSESGENVASFIDYNGYNLATQTEHDSVQQADVVDFGPSNAAYYSVYNGDYPMPHSLHMNLQQNDHLMGQDSIVSPAQYIDNQVTSQSLDSADQYMNPVRSQGSPRNHHSATNDHRHQGQQNFGQPTRDGTNPKDLLAPGQGVPSNTISSPAIDAIANMPKLNMQQLASKIPQAPTPQFSFSSSKDPMEKVKAVNQKKRTMMRQAEQLARLMIDSVNKKFGTTIGDQTDIPFVLSTLGPLGFAQNLLLDPSLLITLLSSTEKGYLSDVLPTPAKMIIRPVLNAFRMPNKKRDKGNLLNVLSYISSGLQAPGGLQPNHRQGSVVKKSGTVRKY